MWVTQTFVVEGTQHLSQAMAVAAVGLSSKLSEGALWRARHLSAKQSPLYPLTAAPPLPDAWIGFPC